MNSERNSILSMVATGRITPLEAERLLTIWRDGDETILRLALCLAFAGLLLPTLGHYVDAIGHALAAIVPVVERVFLLIAGVGGETA